jgi:hypothetical protein
MSESIMLNGRHVSGFALGDGDPLAGYVGLGAELFHSTPEWFYIAGGSIPLGPFWTDLDNAWRVLDGKMYEDSSVRYAPGGAPPPSALYYIRNGQWVPAPRKLVAAVGASSDDADEP